MRCFIVMLSALFSMAVSKAEASFDGLGEAGLQLELSVASMPENSYQVAGVTMINEYMGDNLGRDTPTDMEKVSNSCSYYGYLAASDCTEHRKPAGPVSPRQGLTCYKSCVCDTSYYKFATSNCKSPKVVGGEFCSDLSLLSGAVLASPELNASLTLASAANISHEIGLASTASSSSSSSSSSVATNVSYQGWSSNSQLLQSSGSLSPLITSGSSASLSSQASGAFDSGGTVSGFSLSGYELINSNKSLIAQMSQPSLAATTGSTSGDTSTGSELQVAGGSFNHYSECNDVPKCSTYGYSESSTDTKKDCTKVSTDKTGGLTCYECKCKSEFSYATKPSCAGTTTSCTDGSTTKYRVDSWVNGYSTDGKCTCLVGYYRSASLTCTACSAGYYQDKAGQTSCKKCPAGTYSSAAGSSGCTSCPAGTYSSADGSTKCSECSGAREYQNETGQTSCKTCVVPMSVNDSHTSCTSLQVTGVTGSVATSNLGVGLATRP